MAEVFEGEHVELGCRVAIKLMRSDIKDRVRARHRFLSEAKALAALRSPNLVAVTDVGVSAGGEQFTVLELLQGRDLRQLLKETERLAVHRAAQLLLGAVKGLKIAHEVGLVHRDLKPENLFVVGERTNQEVCKVIDFGLAKQDDGVNFSREGSLLGTVRYMAPEQVRCEQVDQRTDIHALGLVLYECICGVPAFAGEHQEEVLFSILHEVPPDPRLIVPNLGPRIARVIERATQKYPADRFQSAQEFEAELVELAADTSESCSHGLCAGAQGDRALEQLTLAELGEPVGIHNSRKRGLTMGGLWFLLVASAACGAAALHGFFGGAAMSASTAAFLRGPTILQLSEPPIQPVFEPGALVPITGARRSEAGQGGPAVGKKPISKRHLLGLPRQSQKRGRSIAGALGYIIDNPYGLPRLSE